MAFYFSDTEPRPLLICSFPVKVQVSRNAWLTITVNLNYSSLVLMVRSNYPRSAGQLTYSFIEGTADMMDWAACMTFYLPLRIEG